MKLESTFRYRSFWLGFAMIIVMVSHSYLNLDSRLYTVVQKYGYAGVDFFVFASGIGCYYSLEKNPDILDFLKRRLRKLGPVYLCFIVPWMLWKSFSGSLPVEAVLGNLLGIQSFVSWSYHFNWYVSALVLFYLLLPYMKRFVDSSRNCFTDCLTVLLFFLLAVPFRNSQCQNMIILSRLPILCLGVLYGKLGKRGAVLTKKSIVLHFLAFVFGCLLLNEVKYASMDLLWYKGLHWYPFLLIVPGCCLFLSVIGTFLLRFRYLKPLYHLIEKLGIYSFELYLVHVFLFEHLMPVWLRQFPHIPANTLWFIAFCAVIPLSFLLNRSAAFLPSLCRKPEKSR